MPIKLSAAPLSADDRFTFSETAATSALILDVRANDGKNAGKTLYALDNGQSADLANGDAIAATGDRSALGASISITANGTVRYDPAAISALIDALAPGQILEDSFLYALQTSTTAGQWSTVRITFTGTNDVPVATADVAALPEGSVLSGNVGSNDRDVDNGAILSFAPAAGPLPAGFSMNSSGGWTFNANDSAYDGLAAGQVQTLVVGYTVTDQYGASAGSSLTIKMTGTNDAPVAEAGGGAVDEGSRIAGQAYARDADSGAVLSYAVAGEAPAGFTLAANGAWTFDARHSSYNSLAAGEVRTVVLNYTATDQHGASSASTISVKVTGTNDAPVAEPASAGVAEDARVTGQLSATDADGGAVLTYAVAGEAPAGFALAANGAWTFDADHPVYDSLAVGEVRTVLLNYTVADQHGASSASSVSVTVTGTNDAPVAEAANAAVTEDAQVAGRLSANDADGGAVLSYAIAGEAPAGFALAANGAWTFDATDPAYRGLAAGQVQTVALNYTVTDEHGASSGSTLTIRVTGTNDVPVAEAASANVAEDARVTGQLSASDADGGAVLSYALVGDAPAGFTLSGNGAWTFDAADPAYQGLAAGEVQTLLLDYTATDEHGASSGSTLTIRVTGTNDAPVAEAGSAGVAEDAQLSGQLSASDADRGAVLSYALVGSAPAGFVLASDGAWTFDASESAYQGLAAGEARTLSLDYTVTDEHGASSASTLAIEVTGTNDAPAAEAASAAVAGDGRVAGQLGASDPDAGAVLSYALVGEAPAGFTLAGDGAWTFDAGQPGYGSLAAGEVQTVALDYTVTDEHGASSRSTLTLEITGTNDAPAAEAASAAVAEDGLVSGRFSASDVDHGVTLSFSLDGDAPAGFTLSADGSWTFDARHVDYQALGADETLSLSVAYRVTDEHGASTTSTLSLTVTGTNDGPVVLLPATRPEVAEGQSIGGKLLATDADAGATFLFALDGTAPAGFALVADGSWTFDASGGAYDHLAAGETLLIELPFTSTDEHGATGAARLVVSVTGTNDGPTHSGTPVVLPGGLEDTPYSFGLAELLAGWSDPDGDPLSVGSISVSSGSISVSGGTVTYTPVADASGPVTINYQVADSHGAASAASASFTVAAVNDAAVIGGTRTGSVTEAALGNAGVPTSSGQLTIADKDSPASFRAVTDQQSLSGYGTVSLTAAGAWTYSLDNKAAAVERLATGQTVTDSFWAVAADGTQSLVTITVRGANDFTAPSASTAMWGDPNDQEVVQGGWGYADQVVFGTEGADRIVTNDGKDRIYGKGGNDELYGYNGDDLIFGDAGDDQLFGQVGNDQLIGGIGNDVIYFGSGQDIGSGSAGNDIMYGGSGADDFSGNEGDDVLIGGWGRDYTQGGAGADRFVYLDLRDTNDILEDFVFGVDTLDFSALDANAAVAGDQAFAWGGLDPRANGVWMTQVGSTVTFYADTDGNVATAEFMVVISGTSLASFDQAPASILF
ncbi:MAG TPA: VCBS domain-containing protein [Allosphingosinicella sp.]|jgi:VCBS repeat-containing protein